MTDIIEQPVTVRGTTKDKAPEPALSDTAIRGKDLDEAKAREALKAAEEARRNASSDLEIAKVEAEMSSIAAQLAAIRKRRGR